MFKKKKVGCCVKLKFLYFTCKNRLKFKVFSKIIKVKVFQDFLSINCQIQSFSVKDLSFFATLIVHTYMYTINKHNISNYISCKT